MAAPESDVIWSWRGVASVVSRGDKLMSLGFPESTIPPEVNVLPYYSELDEGFSYSASAELPRPWFPRGSYASFVRFDARDSGGSNLWFDVRGVRTVGRMVLGPNFPWGVEIETQDFRELGFVVGSGGDVAAPPGRSALDVAEEAIDLGLALGDRARLTVLILRGHHVLRASSPMTVADAMVARMRTSRYWSRDREDYVLRHRLGRAPVHALVDAQAGVDRLRPPYVAVTPIADASRPVGGGEADPRRLEATLGVLCVASARNDPVGEKGGFDWVSSLVDATRRRLGGWTPLDGWAPLQHKKGEMMAIDQGAAWWMDQWTTSTHAAADFGEAA